MQETPQQRAQRIEPMLAAAGFHVLAADTPEITARFRDPAGNVIGLYQQPT